MPLQTGHIGLNVTDLGRSIDFYQSTLGFEVLGQSDQDGQKFAFLGDPNVASEVFLDKLAITLWEQSAGEFSTRTPGLHHLAFHVDSVDDVEHLRQRVQDAGVELLYGGEIIPHSDSFSSGGFFFLDPDGVRLEICAPDGVPTADAVAGATPSCGFFD